MSRRTAAVARAVGSLADRYDLANRVLTLGLDARWRRNVLEVAAVQPGEKVLDVEAGRGDLAMDLAEKVGPEGSVMGVDSMGDLLRVARGRLAGRNLPLSFEPGDPLHLLFSDDAFDLVVSAFGLSRSKDRQAMLNELARVTRPGGRVVLMDVTEPANGVARTYMKEVVPRLGKAIARLQQASFVPPGDVLAPEDLGRAMQQAGFRKVRFRLLNVGTVAMHWATKPEGQASNP